MQIRSANVPVQQPTAAIVPSAVEATVEEIVEIKPVPIILPQTE